MKNKRGYIIIFVLILSLVLIISVLTYEKDLSKVIDIDLLFESNLVIKETFRGSTSIVQISDYEIDQMFEVLSDTKYVKKEEYKPKLDSYFEVFLVGNLDRLILIIDEDGVIIEDTHYTKYVLRKEKAQELINLFAKIIDENNKSINSINRADYMFLVEVKSSEFSIFDLFNRVNIDYSNIEVNSISASISNKNKLNTLTITYNDLEIQKKYRLKYDYLMGSFTIKEENKYNFNSVKSNYTHLILKSFDSLLKLSGELNGNAINRLIELYSSNIKNIEGNNQKVYYNNELNHDGNISGITFTVYDQYSTEENEILFYVYNK